MIRIFILSINLFASSIIAYPQTSGFVKIKNGTLHYRIFGTGAPLLFLNGGPGFSSEGYERYADLLDENRRVILFDQRGTGKSKVNYLSPNTINIKKMVKDIECLRKHLNIDKWDIMGQSFGGLYAMMYVAKYPKRVKKLILTSSAGVSWKMWKSLQKFNVPDIDEMIPEERKILTELTQELNLKSYKNVNSLKSALSARYYVYKQESIPIAVDWFAYKANKNEYVSKFVRSSLKRFDLRSKLKHFSNPVLIIHGISDFLNINIPLETHKIFPNSSLEIIYDCGHMILLDQPQKMRDIIYNFLNNQ